MELNIEKQKLEWLIKTQFNAWLAKTNKMTVINYNTFSNRFYMKHNIKDPIWYGVKFYKTWDRYSKLWHPDEVNEIDKSRNLFQVYAEQIKHYVRAAEFVREPNNEFKNTYRRIKSNQARYRTIGTHDNASI